MQIENNSINMQVLYGLCQNMIYQHSEFFSKALDNIIIVPSWVNTIDSLDVSMISSDTVDLVTKLREVSDPALYVSVVTEITIILNNIFYSSTKPYRQFWKENALYLYNNLIFPLSQQTNDDLKQLDSTQIYLNDYYHEFFTKFQDKCLRSGFTVALEEFAL